MPSLKTTVNGVELPNPFVIGSGPPGTNANVIAKAFDEGWGAVIAKTVSLDASKVVNVAPRYARMRVGPKATETIVGWQNIELISDRPFETWEEEFRQVKAKYPGRVLIASIMEEYAKDRWVDCVERCQAAVVDPIALRMVMECARMMAKEFPKATISGIGGVETGEDAAQFILLGAHTVQVCTGVMIHGYKLIHELNKGLLAFMEQHKFEALDAFRGHSLKYFTTHADLVLRQATAKEAEKA